MWTDDGRRTDDGGLPYYKLPRSLRLRGAYNEKFSNTWSLCLSIFVSLDHWYSFFLVYINACMNNTKHDELVDNFTKYCTELPSRSNETVSGFEN